VSYDKGVVIVPTGNPNSHRPVSPQTPARRAHALLSYEIGLPYQTSGGDQFYKWGSTSDKGNHMTCKAKYLRLASLEEVIAVVTAQSYSA
jgi:hypothetical protein